MKWRQQWPRQALRCLHGKEKQKTSSGGALRRLCLLMDGFQHWYVLQTVYQFLHGAYYISHALTHLSTSLMCIAYTCNMHTVTVYPLYNIVSNSLLRVIHTCVTHTYCVRMSTQPQALYVQLYLIHVKTTTCRTLLITIVTFHCFYWSCLFTYICSRISCQSAVLVWQRAVWVVHTHSLQQLINVNLWLMVGL